MRPALVHRALAFALALLGAVTARAEELPPIPIGEDAYLQWERWPQLRIGARTMMRSTWDRAGRNEGSDASHFLYQLAPDRNITLDVEGRGFLAFVRFNRWHGSPWSFVVDGKAHVVRDTSTPNPDAPDPNSVMLPADVFAPPLALPWPVTKGADLSWVPMPFGKSLSIEYARTFYGTGYYIYTLVAPGVPTSRPIETWKPGPPDPRVLDLLNRAGTDIAPKTDAPGVSERSGVASLAPGTTTALFSSAAGAGTVRAIKLSVPAERAVEFGRTRLRITWDGAAQPSVDAPVALFFGAGTLYNDDKREWLVKALPVSIRFADGRAELACYFPMPFFESAKIELQNTGTTSFDDVRWSVRTEPLTMPRNHVGKFHATYRDTPHPKKGYDVEFLDTKGVEAHADWSGHIVGTSFVFSHAGDYFPTEGDPRFYFDGSRTPQVQGTGTEEWGGGGDGWWQQRVTLPLNGHPVGCNKVETATGTEDLIQSAYRFLLADAMPFGNRARIGFEHGQWNDEDDHYESIVYWYGVPSPTLVSTDRLDVGEPVSEKAHSYLGRKELSTPYTVRSRFDWGLDTLDGQELYPAHEETGRRTGIGSAFTMRIDPENEGVMLRRTLDYAFPNQRAEIFVADDPDVQPVQVPPGQGWKSAGIWYTAGSTLGYGSWPPKELDPPQIVVQISNRRFVDDEFFLPRELTRGRDRVRIGVRLLRVNRPLLPATTVQHHWWTEIAYEAFCYKLPE